MSLSCYVLMLMLFLSLSPVGCSCSFFSICHFSYNFPILICCILFLFLLSVPDVIILMLSNFNSSQMLEFDDFWKLVATSLLQVSSQMKNLFPIFFPFFLCLEGSSFFQLWLSNSPVEIFQLGISFFVLSLRSWMSPHVMYGSAGCVSTS